MTKTLLAALALSCLSTFAHAQSCAVQAGDKKLATYLHGTRIGVVVEFTGDDTAAKDVAMHVAAMKPVAPMASARWRWAAAPCATFPVPMAKAGTSSLMPWSMAGRGNRAEPAVRPYGNSGRGNARPFSVRPARSLEVAMLYCLLTKPTGT